MSHKSTKIFISYSHDSTQHRAAVLDLANRLRHDGIDCMIDQYINGFPEEGWQRWMENQIEQADYVLIICTPLYLKRYRGKDDNGGRGVTFEGVVISQSLYDAYYRNTKFVSVLPANGSIDHIPMPIKSFGAFLIDKDYEAMYRYVTGQAATPMPDLGKTVLLNTNQHSSSKTRNENSLEIQHEPFLPKKEPMSDTLKAAWVTGILTLLGAVIAGIITLSSGPNNTTHGAGSPIITGNGNQVTTSSPDKTASEN